VEWPWVRARRRRQRAERLPAEVAARVAALVPAVAALDAGERAVHEGLMAVFLHEKTFEGCGGLAITDDVRWTIAATACLLLVHLDVDEPFPGLDVVRVYPGAVQVPRTERDGWVVTDGPVPHAGLSSRRGYVVLAWDAARAGSADPGDGHNVVLHEFAHQLDGADGAMDGAPVLPGGLYGPWARILGAAWDRLHADLAAARAPALDPYAAHSPAEFFAVATEAFFERPDALRAREPALYEVLRSWYRPDRAASVSPPGP
jgi:Mlc titration factor MtfA (ptsG expression regulator)